MKISLPESLLERIAQALERLAPSSPDRGGDIAGAEAFIWQAEDSRLDPVAEVSAVDMELLKGISEQRDSLLANTRNFARGFPANNALLWGARGMGKSSLVKAVHGKLNENLKSGEKLVLVEIHREDISSLPRLLTTLRQHKKRRFLLFCDDLSFDRDDTSYKSLKAVLEGGIEGRPNNVVFYATSNRRHLMAREMIDNEQSTAINPSEAIDEKVSLSDRFGLWLGFHNCDQDTYLAMVESYAAYFSIEIKKSDLLSQAHEWSMTRGARSGRVAWQFIQHLAGTLGKKIV